MSKQGEEYERFVQDVYRVLNANDGLSDVVVQHNVKLKGISREHQIDVYWQFSYGTVTYRVAVECKDYKNPVTAEKIEAFRSTLLDIGNIQGIFASRNGFQSGAQQVAKAYGIQLMQIREPLASDWNGYIKDIYINYIFRSILNVHPIISVDLDWAEKNKIDKDKVSGFHSELKGTFVVINKGTLSECKTSFAELINKLPCDKEGKNKIFVEKYDDAYLEYKDISMKIKGIKLEYDVQFSYEQQHIDALDMAKAVVNNVITGKSLLINVCNIVSDFGGKKTEIEVRE